MATSQDECRISYGRLKGKGEVLAETDGAFLVPSIDAPGVAWLIEPKEHLEDVLDLPDNWWRMVKDLLPYIPGFFQDPSVFNISINLGPTAGRQLPHLHFWIIRREDGKPSSGKGLLALMLEVDGAA